MVRKIRCFCSLLGTGPGCIPHMYKDTATESERHTAQYMRDRELMSLKEDLKV